jgi:ElaB/YqjD/DUF883 family membrane-anchored ribosome-binding protein
MANGDEQTENNKEQQQGARPAGRRRQAGSSKASSLKDEAPRLASAVSEARQSFEVMLDDWREMVEERPWRALGIALGAGYVVGGGLLTSLTGRILFGALRIGVRMAALPLVRDELMGLVQNATERGRGETERRHQ